MLLSVAAMSPPEAAMFLPVPRGSMLVGRTCSACGGQQRTVALPELANTRDDVALGARPWPDQRVYRRRGHAYTRMLVYALRWWHLWTLGRRAKSRTIRASN